MNGLKYDIDHGCPDVPPAIFSPDFTQEAVLELWGDVLTEALDINYMNRSHHNVGTYDQGCRGPLCTKALREHPRRKTPVGSIISPREERIYDPILEYFHVVARHRIRQAQQEILKNIRENT